MPAPTNEVIPKYDFSAALALTLDERLERCIERARARMKRVRDKMSSDFPEIPGRGGSEAELAAMEERLGVALPAEYRTFLGLSRYLVLSSGFVILGLDHNGVYLQGPPSFPFSDETDRYLQFAEYWGYADGDGLMFDLEDPEQPVIAYLHEAGPLYEYYAPSFSLALWRMIDELERWDEEEADPPASKRHLRLYDWVRRILGG